MKTTSKLDAIKMQEALIVNEKEMKEVKGGKARREAELEAESCACECG